MTIKLGIRSSANAPEVDGHPVEVLDVGTDPGTKGGCCFLWICVSDMTVATAREWIAIAPNSGERHVATIDWRSLPNMTQEMVDRVEDPEMYYEITDPIWTQAEVEALTVFAS